MSQFAEYARSAAFRIDLSPAMIAALLGQDGDKLIMTPYWALRRRGLIEWAIVDGKTTGPRLTEAGEHVAALLRLAGFERHATATPKESGQ